MKTTLSASMRKICFQLYHAMLTVYDVRSAPKTTTNTTHVSRDGFESESVQDDRKYWRRQRRHGTTNRNDADPAEHVVRLGFYAIRSFVRHRVYATRPFRSVELKPVVVSVRVPNQIRRSSAPRALRVFDATLNIEKTKNTATLHARRTKNNNKKQCNYVVRAVQCV